MFTTYTKRKQKRNPPNKEKLHSQEKEQESHNVTLSTFILHTATTSCLTEFEPIKIDNYNWNI